MLGMGHGIYEISFFCGAVGDFSHGPGPRPRGGEEAASLVSHHPCAPHDSNARGHLPSLGPFQTFVSFIAWKNPTPLRLMSSGLPCPLPPRTSAPLPGTSDFGKS